MKVFKRGESAERVSSRFSKVGGRGDHETLPGIESSFSFFAQEKIALFKRSMVARKVMNVKRIALSQMDIEKRRRSREHR